MAGNLHTEGTKNISDNIVESQPSGWSQSENESEPSAASGNSKQKRRRRSYDLPTLDLQPVTKKRLTISQNLLLVDHLARSPTSSHIDSFKRVNFVWMLSHKFEITKTPMWVGYNSLIREDTSKQQKFSYLTTINSSPTDPTVVKETMRQSVQAADECGREYMQVTYDSAIAKIALQIQANEDDENLKNAFARLFINLGSFYIQLACFKAIGKFLTIVGSRTLCLAATF